MSSRRPRPWCTHAPGPTAVSAQRSSGSDPSDGTAAVKRDGPGGLTPPYFWTGWTARKSSPLTTCASPWEPQGGNYRIVIRGQAAADKIIHHGYRPSRIKATTGTWSGLEEGMNGTTTPAPSASMSAAAGMGRR